MQQVLIEVSRLSGELHRLDRGPCCYGCPCGVVIVDIVIVWQFLSKSLKRQGYGTPSTADRPNAKAATKSSDPVAVGPRYRVAPSRRCGPTFTPTPMLTARQLEQQKGHRNGR